MSTPHTIGPWYFTTPENEGIREARRIKTSGLKVADSDVEIIFAGVEAPLITEADARLISAAPDLLAALENSQRWLGKFMADRGESDPTGVSHACQRQYDRNTAALKKATS